MKTTIPVRAFFVAASLLALGQPLRSLAADEPRATVVFENPEKFTDVKDSTTGTDKGRDHYLGEFRKLIEEEAARWLPAGRKLAITFTDIDLAGDYLPSMAANRNIRVMKDIYIPRMKFSYSITDASGAVVKEGQQAISDMNYLNDINMVNRGEELFYDKTLLRNWLRDNLR